MNNIIVFVLCHGIHKAGWRMMMQRANQEADTHTWHCSSDANKSAIETLLIMNPITMGATACILYGWSTQIPSPIASSQHQFLFLQPETIIKCVSENSRFSLANALLFLWCLDNSPHLMLGWSTLLLYPSTTLMVPRLSNLWPGCIYTTRHQENTMLEVNIWLERIIYWRDPASWYQETIYVRIICW